MMKKFIAPLLALLVSGCQIDPYTHAPTLTSTDWYDVGMEDAISGSAIKVPASCNNVESASQLHEVWQKGADENAIFFLLN
ncbi:putative excinuclease ATPase subunit [Shigella sonnei]|uniref:hypothetical protein n=1 Tax=Shigella sonnei TaxID=624 RepID=UPI000E2E3472|nr:hypothetical protein [Shigella sonnei]SVG92645.1 putative excinuclease ATPase subunit [Shigella sonnei]